MDVGWRRRRVEARTVQRRLEVGLRGGVQTAGGTGMGLDIGWSRRGAVWLEGMIRRLHARKGSRRVWVRS